MTRIIFTKQRLIKSSKVLDLPIDSCVHSSNTYQISNNERGSFLRSMGRDVNNGKPLERIPNSIGKHQVVFSGEHSAIASKLAFECYVDSLWSLQGMWGCTLYHTHQYRSEVTRNVNVRGSVVVYRMHCTVNINWVSMNIGAVLHLRICLM